MLSSDQVGARAAEMLQTATKEWAKLKVVKRYARGYAREPWTPSDADAEYKALARKCQTPWASLVVRAKTQGLAVDGHTHPALWGLWLRSGMVSRQDAFMRDCAEGGYSWLVADVSESGEFVMQPCASNRGCASWASDWIFDLYPVDFLRLVRDHSKAERQVWQYVDAEARWDIYGRPSGRHEVARPVPHDFGVCPVSMIPNESSLDDMPSGEIAPIMRSLDRISDATFTLQMVQRYGAFPVKWASGWPDATVDANGDPLEPDINPNVDSLLTSNLPDARFGNFAATDLRQVIEALETHIKHVASVAQVPPYYLLGGSMSNISEDLIYASEMGRKRKIIDTQEVMSDRIGAILDLGAAHLGLEPDPEDRVTWRSVDMYSLPRAADAFVKLRAAGMTPERALSYMPGMSASDIAAEAQAMNATTSGPGPSEPSGDVSVDLTRAVQAQATALGMLVRSGVDPVEAAQRVGLGGLAFTGAVPVSLRLPEQDATRLEP